jgi:hypothetical protein
VNPVDTKLRAGGTPRYAGTKFPKVRGGHVDRHVRGLDQIYQPRPVLLSGECGGGRKGGGGLVNHSTRRGSTTAGSRMIVAQ